jgi:nitrogen fixation NifU-like protein
MKGLVLERFRHPLFRGAIESPDACGEAFNALCGDRIRLELRLKQGAIAAARHRGDACAICIAAADLLSEMIEGLATHDALAISTETLVARLEAEISPSRVQCVALPLVALRQGLETQGQETR